MFILKTHTWAQVADLTLGILLALQVTETMDVNPDPGCPRAMDPTMTRPLAASWAQMKPSPQGAAQDNHISMASTVA